jgi:hypothetical protein
MKVDRLRLDVERPGAAGAPPTIEPVTVAALRGPGDNCTMVVPVVLAADGRPSVVVKAGSTRAAAELREPGRYVMLGMVGGRWDKSIGADAAGIAKKIGIAELAEEIGATAVKGGAFTLGDRLTATMPSISTEADLAVGVLARVSADATPTGDHSGMEVVGLMKPVALEPRDALARSRRGELGEGARFEAYTRRFLDKLGFVPELDAYVFDLPPALRKAFDTRGLGAPLDPRKLAATDESESAGEAAHAGAAPPPPPAALAAAVKDVAFLSASAVPVPELGATMFDAQTDHVSIGDDGARTLLGKAHPNQLLHVPHDLAKLVRYVVDPARGPLVALEPIERPLLAAKGTVLAGELAYPDEDHRLVRPELPELVVPLGLDASQGLEALRKQAAQIDGPARAKAVVDAALAGEGASAKALGAPTFASPGQSDLRLHFYAAELPADVSKAALVPIGDALARARRGELDAGAEATLLRLADAIGWIPSLGMHVDAARKLAGLAGDEG